MPKNGITGTTECTENTETPSKKNLSVKSVFSVVP